MNLTCKDVMNENQITVKPETNVVEAFNLIRKYKVRYLPVLEDDGTYIGVFTSPTLIKMMLPAAATIKLTGNQSSAMVVDNLNFFEIEAEDFAERLDYLVNEKVGDHLSKKRNIPIVSPNKGIMDGVMLLHKYKRHLILVEPETRKFVGVLTINSVLSHLFEIDKEFEFDET